VTLAWQVDPCLALSLLDHFPAVAALREALEGQVVRHCHDPQVRSAVAGLPSVAAGSCVQHT
jgi:hypothetical protein